MIGHGGTEIYQTTNGDHTKLGNTTEKPDGNKILPENVFRFVKNKEMETKFYEFNQNNSGGGFDVDDKVCHRLFIEATSLDEAISKAENLGCYWNGVDNGMDCECCGDRWYEPSSHVDLEEINKRWKGYEVSEYLSDRGKKEISDDDAIRELVSVYEGSEWLVAPKVDTPYGTRRVSGKIKLVSIEQYAQLMADLYGWTKPDCRIFYHDGSVKDVYSKKVK